MHRKTLVPLLVLLPLIFVPLALPACRFGTPPGAMTLPAPYNPPPQGEPLTLQRVVRFEHRQVNSSDQPADIELFIAVPRDNERQAVRFFEPDPTLIGESTDEYGNRILHYRDRQVPPGEVVAHGWIAEVAISSHVHDPLQLRRGKGMITPEQKELFLRDGAVYQIHSPAVSGLARELKIEHIDDEYTVRRFFDYMINNVRYERDDVWDPAPQVLERKSGSCSEYNYAFVALCRSAGIPARYTGGLVLSPRRVTAYDRRITEDAVFHRWSEVYLEHRGWMSVDCSRASGEIKRFGNPENYYGRLPAGLLQCMRGDGLGDAPLGWDYLSRPKLGYPEKKDWAGKVAFWIDGVKPGTVKTRCAAIAKRLEQGPQDRALFDDLVKSPLDREVLFLYRNRLQRKAAVDLAAALHAVGHPEAIYWSILAAHRKLDVPENLRLSALCGDTLQEQIAKHLKPLEGGDLFTFEYWWRKARPVTRFDREKGVFVLTRTEINIY
jgi:transglutaminase-like putative cysteine protease